MLKVSKKSRSMNVKIKGVEWQAEHARIGRQATNICILCALCAPCGRRGPDRFFGWSWAGYSSESDLDLGMAQRAALIPAWSLLLGLADRT